MSHMKRFSLPLLLLVSILLSGCVGNTPDGVLLKGLEAHRAGDWWGAIHYFETYLQKWPEHDMHEDAVFYLADSHFNADNKDRAEDYFRQFITDYPGHTFAPRARVALAILLESKSRRLAESDAATATAAWQEAREVIAPVLHLEAYEMRILRDQARVFLANSQFIHGNTEEALRVYEERMEHARSGLYASQPGSATPVIDQENANVWYDSLRQMASMYARAENWEKAREMLGTIRSATFMQMHPEVVRSSFLEIAATYRQEGRVDEAVEVYKKMRDTLAADDVDMATYNDILTNRFIADALIGAGSVEQATGYLDPVYVLCESIYSGTAAPPGLAVYAGINLAEIQLIRGATGEAEDTLTRVLLDYPNVPMAALAERKLQDLRYVIAHGVPAATDAAAVVAPSLATDANVEEASP